MVLSLSLYGCLPLPFFPPPSISSPVLCLPFQLSPCFPLFTFIIFISLLVVLPLVPTSHSPSPIPLLIQNKHTRVLILLLGSVNPLSPSLILLSIISLPLFLHLFLPCSSVIPKSSLVTGHTSCRSSSEAGASSVAVGMRR